MKTGSFYSPLTLVLLALGLTDAFASVLYVDLNGANPTPPYANWNTAATNIQDAVDAAKAGDQILVGNGIYQTGGRLGPQSANAFRVVVTNTVLIQSVNGPGATAIDGGGTCHCVYLAGGSTLGGFTLTNGMSSDSGGGVFCASTEASVTNCVMVGNSAGGSGGGAFSGTLSNCTITGNRAVSGCGAQSSTLLNCTISNNSSTVVFYCYGGGLLNCLATNCTIVGNSCYYGAGAYQSTLNNCSILNNSGSFGGGAYSSVLNNCIVTGNWAGALNPPGGGGLKSSTANNCLIAGNSAGDVGGVDSSTLNNCTIVANSSAVGSGGNGCGGANASFLTNCIVYDNTIPYNTNTGTFNHTQCTLSFCCTTPMPATGSHNITNAPLFLDSALGDYHLVFESPCVNSGNNLFVTSPFDLDGNPRVVGGIVDMGAYEFQTAPPGIYTDYTSFLINFAVGFNGFVSPDTTNFVWDFGDGTMVSNILSVAHGWAMGGDYLVILRAYTESNPGGISATTRVHVASQVVSYVNATGTNPVPPFSSWGTAATNIQDAVDVVMPGTASLVLVTNGFYGRGGRGILDGTTNRVVVAKSISLRSVNGPAVTFIDGGKRMRCVYLTNGSVMEGFSLVNGNAVNGGGVYCASNDVLVSRCEMVGDAAQDNGGGAYGGTLEGCALALNSATNSGGGAFGAALDNCTLIGNSSGADTSALNNCIVFYSAGYNVNNCTVTNCCTTPGSDGTGNITGEPQLADFAHITAGSPCRGTGDPAYSTGEDIDGETWLTPPSIGCDEYTTNSISGPLNVSLNAGYTTVAKGFSVDFSGWITGHARFNFWDFGDGTTVSNRLYAAHSWSTPGDYVVSFTACNDTYPTGVSATTVVHITGETHYVNLSSTQPTAPYVSWATAATNIQDAVDAVSAPGALVLVSNGVYKTGGRIVDGALSNRVAITKPLVLQSVNGPGVTSIEGYKVPGTNFGDAAVRCVYLTNNAVLTGFTVTNGATRASGDLIKEESGGGVLCISSNVIVSNCVLVANAAFGANGGYGPGGGGGGGIFQGTLYGCTLIGNSAPNGKGGAAFHSVLSGCILGGNSAVYGGGSCDSVLNSCWITNNTAGTGGGTSGNTAILSNCILMGNFASFAGGGASEGSLNNCTVVSNSSSGMGGGAYFSGAGNSILYYNTAPGGSNYASGTFQYCCTGPEYYDYHGTFDSPPLFVNLAAGDLRLQSNSPCINSGNNDYVQSVTDLDGNPRITGGFVDMGAYELPTAQPPSAYVLADYTNVIAGFAEGFKAGYNWGRATSATWDFGDGTVVSNTLSPTHAWVSVGDYRVIAQVYAANNSSGLSATTTVHVASQILYYVNGGGTNPVSPYSTWQTAATNIQDAVDAAVPAPGAIVLVTNGTYNAGGRVVYGAMTNRLAVTKPISVQSVQGPEATIIQGSQLPGLIYGDGALRCVYLTNNASLAGFTCTGGGTRISGANNEERSGGGIWCAGTNVYVTNCVVSGNSASWSGGGAFQGSFSGCTFDHNHAEYNAGGGAEGCSLRNCFLVANSSSFNGGAADLSSLINCDVSGNAAAASGGGVSASTLINCTLTGNSARVAGGGSFNSALTNCIVYYNNAPAGTNSSGDSMSYCCTIPLAAGFGNIVAEPQITDRFHISSTSPCRGTGNGAYATGFDLDGEAWLSPPSIGCDEFHAGTISGLLGVGIIADYTNVACGYSITLSGSFSGHASASIWDFGDGTFVTNQPTLSKSWPVGGQYAVVLTAYSQSYPAGISATSIVQVLCAPTHFVSLKSTNPIAPYLSWSTAATNIQDAVDGAFPGGLVLVSNGTYQSGGRVIFGFLTNRLAISKAVTVQSVGGPGTTIIQGSGGIGDNAVRCVYLGNKAALVGFSLTNGATRSAGDLIKEQSGGGVFCESTNCLVLGCLIGSNSAARYGGGVYSGMQSNCTLFLNTANGGGGSFGGYTISSQVYNNFAVNGGGGYSNTFLSSSVSGNKASSSGGAAYYSNFTNSTVSSNSASQGGGTWNCALGSSTVFSNIASGSGGGASGGKLSNCRVILNRATSLGGGGSSCNFENCLVTSNSASTGGGVYNGKLIGCTVIGNSALSSGGGAYAGSHTNCIIYYNSAPAGTNYSFSSLSFCCTVPMPGSGAGNITNLPQFVDVAGQNFRLQSNSPCINSGNNTAVLSSTDLDGRPRIVNGTVDMGTYEFQGAGAGEFIAWLQQNGLPTDGSADFIDSDGDGLNNWQEWMAGTSPIDALSRLALRNPTPGTVGIVVSWQSVSNRTYFIQRSANLTSYPAFVTLATDIAGQSVTTSYNDTTAVGHGPFFYRVGVEGPVPFLQQPFSSISFAWLQQYGLPTDGSADFIDTDHDGLTNWEEWIAGTDPTNTSSVLKMLAPSNSLSGVSVKWQSVANRTYFLQRSTNLGAQPVFSIIKSNIQGQAGTTTFLNTNAANSGPAFYRVGVQQ